ncbi:MAG: Ig-like domain-containing protein [Synechococcaceae cyanobacterium]|nr:Ig-like domain-containing protein [Synechococcaceae cyanobacterium]
MANVDEVAPTFSSGSSASVDENVAAGTVIYTAVALDTDFNAPATATSITYSLSGSQASSFDINASSGEVSIKASPDYESRSSYSFTVIATDAAGKASSKAVTLSVNDLDEIAPNAPTISSVTDDAGSVSGTVASGGRTDDTVLVLAGSAEASSTVRVYNGTTLLGSTTANASGAWSFTTGTLSDATTYSFRATATDASGNTSAFSSTYTVTGDTTAPTAPTISTVTDNVNPITGTVASGGRTNDTVLLISGTAEANSTVTVYNNSTQLGTATANSSGVWSFTTGTLSDGTTYSFNATATDAVGNVSAASSSYVVTVDTTAPGAPSITSISDDQAPITGTVSSGGRTNDTNLTVRVSLSGTGAMAGDAVQLFNGGSPLAAAVTLVSADISLGYVDLATGSLSDATYTITARLSDIPGNVGSASASHIVTVDTTAPAAPSITSISDDQAPITGTVSSGGRTNDTNLTVRVSLSGTGAVVGDSVRLLNGGSALTAPVTLVSADLSLGYVDLATGTLSDGVTYALSAQLTDSVGNTGAASAAHTVTVDTSAPTAPTISTVTDNVNPITGTVVSGGRTNDTVLLISGTAEASSTVTVYNNSTVLGTATANVSGVWSFTTGTLIDGTTYGFRATATDAAGNLSPFSSTYTVTVDTTAPNAPSITSVTDDAGSITGAILSGGITDDTNPTVRVSLAGTNALAGDTIQLYDSSTAVGSAYTIKAADLSNGYADVVSGTLTDGTIRLNARVLDGAGNPSAASSQLQFTVDSTPPLLPTINVVATNDVINNAEKLAGVVISGSDGANNTITISWGNFTRTTTSSSSGAWSLSYDSSYIPADASSSTITVTATDPAGNSSSQATRTVVIDTVAPLLPTIAQVADNDRINATEKSAGFNLSGNSGANDTIAITWGGVTRTTTASSTGAWQLNYKGSQVPNDSTSSAITVIATDPAGNSSGTASRIVQIDTAAPGTPTINTIAGNNIINAAEKAVGFAISGTDGANNTISITWGGITRTTLSDGSGNWSLTYGSQFVPVDATSSTISVTATDSSGNVSSSASRVVVIDTTTPGSPTIHTVAGDNIISNSERNDGLTLSGTAEANSRVDVNWSGITRSTTADSSGAWSLSYNKTQIPAPGNTTITVTAVDVAGNPSTATTLAVVIEADPTASPPADTQAPDAPVISGFVIDTGVRYDNVTSDNTPTLAISAEIGSTVRVYRNGTEVGTATEGSRGSFSYVSPSLSDGVYNFTVKAEDSSKNLSLASADLSITVDTASATPTLQLASDTGSSNSDGLTRDGTVLVSGLEVGAVWSYSLNSGGNWRQASGNSFALNPGTYAAGSIQVRQTDLAGNTSAAGSLASAVTFDAVNPKVAITPSKASLGLTSVGGVATPESVTVTFTLTELSSDFDTSDITVSGGTLGALSVDATGLIYSGLFTAASNSTTPAVISVASGSFSDKAGNLNDDGADTNNTVSYTVNTVISPGLYPTISLGSDRSSLKANETANLTFTLSKASSDFSAADVSVTGGTLSGFAAGATALTYTALFTPDPGEGVTATISVASGSFSNSDGLTNQDGSDANNTVTIAVDTIAPMVRATSVSFSNDTGSSDTDLITNRASQTISGVLSGNLSDGEVVRLSLDNGSSWINGTATTGDSSFSFSGINLSGPNTLKISVVDAFGNLNPADQLTQAYVFDPATWTGALSLLSYAGTIAVTGVASGTDNSFELSLPNRESGSSTDYEISLDSGSTWSATPAIQSSLPDGTYQFRGHVSDAAGNSAYSDVITVVIDANAPSAPSLALASGLSGTISAAQLGRSTGSLEVTAESGSSVVVTITSSGGGSLSRTFTGSGSTQTILFSNSDVSKLADGTITVTARATDPAGNQGTASTLSFAYVAQPVIGSLSISKGQDGNETGSVPLTFNVSRSGSTAQALTVFYKLTNMAGSAAAGVDYNYAAGSDYAANGYGSLTFAAGSATATISLPVIDNSTVNSTRTLLASLINAPLGYTISSSQSSASASILDNDVAVVVPVISIGTDALSVTEGNTGSTNLSMVVSLSSATTVPVTVAWALTNGSATFDSDYSSAAQSGTLTFAAGEVSKAISVSVLGDTSVETNETFQFSVSSPTNATLSGGAGSLSRTVTITNDDSSVVVDPNAGTTATLTGGSYAATDLNDVITGSGIADTISLKAGDDWVEGKGGADVIAGGLGADLFVYRSASDSNSTTTDRITDFNPTSQGDRIALTALPSKLWNAGVINGTVVNTVLTTALTNAPADAKTAGAAVLVTMGTSSSYLIVSDGVSGLGSGDLVVRTNRLPNSTVSTNPFNTVGYLMASSVFTTI